MYTVYTGELVRLRPFKDDAEHSQAVATAMRQPNDHWGPWYWTETERKQDFENTGLLDPGKYSHFAVERLDTSEVVGWEEHGPLEPGQLSTWLGTDIQRPHWHNGFGLEAKKLMLCYLFENYPLSTVRGDTCGHHVRAQRGLLDCGMRYVGRVQGVHYADGVRHDVLQYQVFHEEWLEQGYWRKVKRGN